ncbi:hypothetical protein AgCh_001101 [Apium graveolens]
MVITSATRNGNVKCQIKERHPKKERTEASVIAESLIKRLQLIAHPLLLRAKLPISVWGHAILHAANIIGIRPSAYHKQSPQELVLGQVPNISHLKVFGCAVYVPISPPQRNKMGPQRRIGIYVGFDSPSIIRYLEPLTSDVFTARYADCHFDESMFPKFREDNDLHKLNFEISWNASGLNSIDSRTNQCESEVQRIIHMQNIANQMPDAFSDSRHIIRSHIPAINAPTRVEIPTKKSIPEELIGDLKPRQKREVAKVSENTPEVLLPPEEVQAPEVAVTKLPDVGFPREENVAPEVAHAPEVENASAEAKVPENYEISMNYVHNAKLLDRGSIEVNDVYAFSVTSDIIMNSDPEPQIQTPAGVVPVGNRWVFVRKRNERNEIVRYKARLVAQGFSQRPGFDYQETYSPVMDGVTFHFLMGMACMEKLETRLMDVVTAYLYGSLDSDIYMKIPEGLNIEDTKPRHLYSVKLQRSLYGLKQSGRMWYNRLREYLLNDGYVNNQVCPCIFIKRSSTGFVIIDVYVDDLNIIGTTEDITNAANYLKNEFEMKDLGRTRFCLGIQVEHLSSGIFVHQSNYTEKILDWFYMDKAHPITTPMVVRSLEVEKDPLHPRKQDEETLGPEVPYLSAIGALMYLANNTRPDIAFAVNLLARFSSDPTKRHWDGIKHTFRYLRGTIDLGLFFPNNSRSRLVGCADVGYMSDPHFGRSKTSYLFTYCDTAISWKSTKQTMAATSSNHAELLAIHEASRECIWLRSVIQHIRESCGLSSISDSPTVLFEDNSACIKQLKEGYIKGDRTKHILPKFFYTHELQENGDINVQQVRSCDNLADILTKSLPTSTFEKLRNKMGMRRRKSRSISPRRRKSRSSTPRRRRSRSATPRRYKRQRSTSISLSPIKRSPSTGSLELKNVTEKSKKDEEEKKRRQQEAELKLLEEETAKRVEEAIRKKVEESLNSEEIQMEIKTRLVEGRKKLIEEVAAQLEKEKEAAVVEARRKEEKMRKEKEELERMIEENRRRVEEAQRREALEQQRREEERYRELEELQRQKEEALRRKKQQEEEEKSNQMKLLGKNKSRPKLSFALGLK